MSMTESEDQDGEKEDRLSCRRCNVVIGQLLGNRTFGIQLDRVKRTSKHQTSWVSTVLQAHKSRCLDPLQLAACGYCVLDWRDLSTAACDAGLTPIQRLPVPDRPVSTYTVRVNSIWVETK